MKTKPSIPRTACPRTVAGRFRTACATRILPLVLLMLPAAVHAQFKYTNYHSTIIITGYTGSGGAVIIPSTIIGLPVTRIEDSAFSGCTSLTSVTIPNSVTSIGSEAFSYCARLTSVTIGNSITNIGSQGFYRCTSLTGVFFQGNAPSLGADVFGGDNNLTVYYLPGTTGWGTAFGGRPTLMWTPQVPLQVQTGYTTFGVRTNRFGFNITGSSGLVIVVEACTNLANPIWVPLQTNTLTGDLFYFSDPRWMNYPARFYRLRSP